MKNLLQAARDVVVNADDAGCSDDLTVTSASAVKRLEREVKRMEKRADDYANKVSKKGNSNAL